ncbi:MAG: hypothetical protein PVJ63_11255 [Thioalkalispiraceae bacterium]|jgi:hypothetical protein
MNTNDQKEIDSRYIGALFWSFLVVSLLFDEYGAPNITSAGWYPWIAKIALNSIAAWYIYVDATRYAHINRELYSSLSVPLTELVYPVYLVKTRGWTGAGLWLLRFTGYLLLAVAFTATTDAIIENIEQLNQL